MQIKKIKALFCWEKSNLLGNRTKLNLPKIFYIDFSFLYFPAKYWPLPTQVNTKLLLSSLLQSSFLALSGPFDANIPCEIINGVVHKQNSFLIHISQEVERVAIREYKILEFQGPLGPKF